MGLFDGYFSNHTSIYYPSTGDKFQLNFVLNVKGNPRVAGVGRIIQDNSASIMKSFTTPKGYCSVNEAELMALQVAIHDS